jgi:hypothetical protein
MRGYLVVAFLVLASVAQAQDASENALAERRPPTPDEQAFANLPQDLQVLLAGMPAREALQKLDFARQNLIALGTPNPTPERLRLAVQAVLAPRYAAVQSASAGTTSFPPLSPLVPAIAFEYR